MPLIDSPKSVTAFPVVRLYCRPGRDGVFPAFPVDLAGKHESAKEWAGNKVSPEDLANGQFRAMLTDVEARSEGGRAWKVHLTHPATSRIFLVDLRETALFEILIGVGCEKGGQILADLGFVKSGSQTRLVLVGGAEWNLAQSTTGVRVAKETMTPGLYEAKGGAQWIYFGKQMVVSFKNETANDVPRLSFVVKEKHLTLSWSCGKLWAGKETAQPPAMTKRLGDIPASAKLSAERKEHQKELAELIFNRPYNPGTRNVDNLIFNLSGATRGMAAAEAEKLVRATCQKFGVAIVE